ncbi:MAG: hypothetical protein EBW15_07970 [Actinobacteria bacterium]|nr:hypothetical protein [Actinomycetota bacterium]
MAVTEQVVPALPVLVSTPPVMEQPAPFAESEYETAPSPLPPEIASVRLVPYVFVTVVTVIVACAARPMVNFFETNVIV